MGTPLHPDISAVLPRASIAASPAAPATVWTDVVAWFGAHGTA
jgi:hypothetical protein